MSASQESPAVRNERTLVLIEGRPFIAVAGLLLAVCLLFDFPWPATALSALLTAFVVWFFRNPRRTIPAGDDLVVAPADGRVVAIAEVDDQRFGLGRCRRVCIFMSPFNVHVNRAPTAGRVTAVQYRPGQFLVASAEKASLDNEQCALTLERENGQRVVAVQIAGMLARRIVTYPREGETLAKGQRYGLIRFGSRVDVYLPLETKIEVMVGDCTFGGVTMIGRFLHG